MGRSWLLWYSIRCTGLCLPRGRSIEVPIVVETKENMEMRKQVALSVACAAVAATVFAGRPLTPQAMETLKHSLIHRGDGKGRPDNTMEALLYTWAKGYTPESDIRYTKDGKIVAFHDNGLKGRKIRDWTWAELRDEDVGSYRGAQYATCRTPLWETIFTAMEENPARKMHIVRSR